MTPARCEEYKEKSGDPSTVVGVVGGEK